MLKPTRQQLEDRSHPTAAPFPEVSTTMKTLVIGLGNPILGDDGVGWRVVERVEQQLTDDLAGRLGRLDVLESIEFMYLSLGGLSLMEAMIGADRVILVDALETGQQPVGSVLSLRLEELPNRAAGHLSSAHDTTLQNALKVGESMGAKLPAEIQVVAIEAEMEYNFSEQLSTAVAAAVPEAARRVISLLEESV